METQLLLDRLRYVDRLTKAGIDQSQARALSDALDEALRDSNIAMKTDIARLEHKIDLTIRDIKIWTIGILILLSIILVTVVEQTHQPSRPGNARIATVLQKSDR